MFESMEITESIYKGVVELSYNKPTRADANRAGCIRQKREENMPHRGLALRRVGELEREENYM